MKKRKTVPRPKYPLTTYRQRIELTMHEHGETWADVEYSTISDAELDAEFEDEPYHATRKAFTVWTLNRVYFPMSTEGGETCESAPRNIDGKPMYITAD